MKVKIALLLFLVLCFFLSLILYVYLLVTSVFSCIVARDLFAWGFLMVFLICYIK